MPRKATAPAQANPNKSTKSPVDDVDKIRDIIFGNQMREYTTRLEQMERNVGKVVERASKDFDKRMEQLERSFDAQLQQLGAKFAKDAARRQKEYTATKAQLTELEHYINETAVESDNRLAAQVEELHEILEEQRKTLGEVIEKSRTELGKSLDHTTDRLERHKIGAKDLAQLFSEMARQLKQNGK